MKPDEERACVERARDDPRAFVHLYDHYFPRVHDYVRYRVSDRQDAEDVIAEVFLKAMRELPRFEWHHRNAFAAWLFRIAHNLVVDYYRDREQDVVAPAPPERLSDAALQAAVPLTSRVLQPEQALAQQETFHQMRALVTTLSPRRQEVVTLRFFGGLRNKDIAHVLDLDERTIASHLSRGLQDLRDRYKAQTALQVLEEVTI
jgi:RNA polymerase sigma-70 factor (ECF subfamily)